MGLLPININLNYQKYKDIVLLIKPFVGVSTVFKNNNLYSMFQKKVIIILGFSEYMGGKMKNYVKQNITG